MLTRRIPIKVFYGATISVLMTTSYLIFMSFSCGASRKAMLTRLSPIKEFCGATISVFNNTSNLIFFEGDRAGEGEHEGACEECLHSGLFFD